MRALWAASVLGGLGQSLAGTASGLLAAQIAGADAVAGLPQAALVVGAAVAALALSGLTRRRSRRVALSTGAVIAVAGCIVDAVAGVSASLPGLLVGGLLLGSGNTAVMLARYAAADLGSEAVRARAMASILVATAIGAVAGPNLLAPASNLASELGWPELVGPYVVAAVGFAFAAFAFLLGPTPGTPMPASAAATAVAQVGPALGRQGASGLVVLGVANLVMVSVMTMAPVHLHHLGVGLGAIGAIVSLHIAGMFAPSPLSGWLISRIGATPAAAVSGALLVLACVLAASGAASPAVLGPALMVLGLGWNLALVAGSVLLTANVPATDRPRREAWGEVAMGAAAAGGGAASGLVVASANYPSLAGAGAVVAALLLPWAWSLRREHAGG